MKEETLDRTVQRTSIGRGAGSAVNTGKALSTIKITTTPQTR